MGRRRGSVLGLGRAAQAYFQVPASYGSGGHPTSSPLANRPFRTAFHGPWSADELCTGALAARLRPLLHGQIRIYDVSQNMHQVTPDSTTPHVKEIQGNTLTRKVDNVRMTNTSQKTYSSPVGCPALRRQRHTTLTRNMESSVQVGRVEKRSKRPLVHSTSRKQVVNMLSPWSERGTPSHGETESESDESTADAQERDPERSECSSEINSDNSDVEDVASAKKGSSTDATRNHRRRRGAKCNGDAKSRPPSVEAWACKPISLSQLSQ